MRSNVKYEIVHPLLLNSVYNFPKIPIFESNLKFATFYNKMKLDFIMIYCSTTLIRWIWILLRVTQRYWYVEYGFCFIIRIFFKLQEKFGIPNLDFTTMYSLMILICRIWILLRCIAQRYRYMLNLVFVTCYTEMLRCWICN